MSSPAKAPVQLDAEAKPKLRVVLAEDNVADSELLLHELRRSGFDLVAGEVAKTPDEFRGFLRAVKPDVVLADYNLGQWRGMDALEIMRDERMEVPLILVSGAVGDVTAVECIKQGATDYVLKDSLTRLPVCIRRALEEKRLRTERAAVQEELKAKLAELARSNDELEQFAYAASHDLQEPLRMVTTYSQLLAERYYGKLDEQADKYIHYAVDGATRMQTLIQDLLAFSRAGRQQMDVDKTDCNRIVEHALQNLQISIKESGTKVSCGFLPEVTVNSPQLQQVFQNLIGNAIKFHGPKKPVVRVEAQKEGPLWVFSVTDNGIGIPPEDTASIFAVFKRLHTRDEFPGNGIGLAICKKIVERHGGRIWVESSKGHGATFKFTIPAEKRTAQGTGATDRHENHDRALVS